MGTEQGTRPLSIRHKNDPCCTTILPGRLTPTQVEHLADDLKAMGDPTRLRLLDLLAQQIEPMCVCDITTQFSLGQPTISHHIRILRQAGLIDGERRGIWSYYSVTEKGKTYLAVMWALL